MRHYHYTDKLLRILAIANLLAFIPFIGSLWFPILLIYHTQGDTGPMWITFLSSTVEGFLVLSIAAWAFFRRLRWVVVAFVLYLSRLIPIYILAMIQDWKDHVMMNFLGSVIYTYCYIFLWLLGLITIIVMLIETNYKNLFNSWRGRFVQ